MGADAVAAALLAAAEVDRPAARVGRRARTAGSEFNVGRSIAEEMRGAGKPGSTD